MPSDDQLSLLLAERARNATDDIVAPSSWSTTVPARAIAHRRRTQAGLGAFVAAGVTAAVVVPLTQTGDQTTPVTPAGYHFALERSTAATGTLPCITGTVPDRPGSTGALSVGRDEPGRAACDTLIGRRATDVPSDARRVPGHGGHLYLAPQSDGYRLGYRSYDVPSGGAQVVLEVALGATVPSAQVVDVLESISLVPPER